MRRVDFFRRRVRLRPESILVGRLASLRVNPDVVRGDRGGLVHRRERRRQRRRLPREIAVRVGDDRAHLRVSLRTRTPSRLGRVLARRGRRSRPRLRRDLIGRTRSHGLARHRFAARGLPPAARHERESTTRWSCSKAGPSTPSTPKKPSSRWGTKARLARLPSRGARLSDGMSHALDARDRCLREFAMRAVRYAPRVSDPIRRFVQKAESDRRCHERAGLWLKCSVHDETEFFLGRSEVHSTGRGGIETRQGWRANPPPRVRVRRKRTAISPRAR